MRVKKERRRKDCFLMLFGGTDEWLGDSGKPAKREAVYCPISASLLERKCWKWAEVNLRAEVAETLQREAKRDLLG